MKLVIQETIPDVLPFFKTEVETQGLRSQPGNFQLVVGSERADLAAGSAISLPGIFT